MTDQPAAFKGTFHDMKFVKGRKQAQVIVEVPIEHAAAVVAAFGAPNPENPVWIALARLDVQPAKEEKATNREAQRAGMLAGDHSFWAFLSAKKDVWINQDQDKYHTDAYDVNAIKENTEISAQYIREFSGVESRADLSPDNKAWNALLAEFEKWKRDI